MWEDSLKGSSVCLSSWPRVGGITEDVKNNPCIINILLPGIFSSIAVIWLLWELNVFSKHFLLNIFLCLYRIIKRIVHILWFFASCFFSMSQKKRKKVEPDIQQQELLKINDINDSKTIISLETLPSKKNGINEPLTNHIIDPTCGYCDTCQRNPLCGMKLLKLLKFFKHSCQPYAYMTLLFGITGLIYNIFLTSIPSNILPNNDSDDSKLKTLISIAPEWNVAIMLLLQGVTAMSVILLINIRLKAICTGLLLIKKAEQFAFCLGVFLLLLLGFIIPSVVTSIDIWTKLGSYNSSSIPISIFWSVLIVLSWLLLIIPIIVAFLIFFRFHSLRRLSESNQSVSFNRLANHQERSSKHVELSDYIDSSETNLGQHQSTDQTWIEDTDDQLIGCGCSCCSKNKQFRPSQIAPEYLSSCLNRLIFDWISPLMALGYSRPIEMDDLYPLPKPLDSEQMELRLTRFWEYEVTKKKQNASLIKACWKFSKSKFVGAGILKLLYDTLHFSGPILLKWLITFLEKCQMAMSEEINRQEQSTVGTLFCEGMGIILLLFICNVVQTLILHQYFHIQYTIGIQLRSALTGWIYKKSLRISSEISQDPLLTDEASQLQANNTRKKSSLITHATTTGEIVNLMAVDAQRLLECMPYIHILWSAPYQIIFALILLWKELGPSMFAGVAVMAASIPITALIARAIKKAQQALMILRDERIKITNESFSGIKIIKVYAWEESFENKINKIRDIELKGLRHYSSLNMAQRILWNGVPAMVSLVSFLAYVGSGHELTAKKAFTSIALFNILRFPLNAFPNVISLSTEAYVACLRIRNFVIRPEVIELPQPPPISMTNSHIPTIVAQHLTVRWPNGVPLLNNITFQCYPKTITAIVGRTGVGKTGLIASIIGDLPQEPTPFNVSEDNPLKSSLVVTGRIAYVAQTPWIQNASIQNNILFGRPYNPKWYAKVIYACALLPDLETLPYGDRTEIGEKGVNLSGGQKQRVSLARAVYQSGQFPFTNDVNSLPADIYVLDDCLSAVDANVGQHIFDNCIHGLLRRANRTILFVTNKVSLLPRMDQIILLDREPLSLNTNESVKSQLTVGKLLAIGNHQSLQTIPLYIHLTKEYQMHQPDEISSLDDSLIYHSLSGSFIESDIALNNLTSDGNFSVSQLKTDMFNCPIRSLTGLTDMTVSRKNSVVDKLTEKLRNKMTSLHNTDNDSMMGMLTAKETVEKGAVTANIYWAYFNGVGGPPIIFFVLLSLALSQSSQVAGNFWLTYWSDHRDQVNSIPTGITVYGLLSLSQIILYGIVVFTMMIASLKASRFFHYGLLGSLLRAPMSFFDATPLGRIMNRFSKDLYTLDQTLPSTMSMYIVNLFSVIATFSVICFATPLFSIVGFPLIIVYMMIQYYYIPTSRQIQRLDSVLKSPIFAHFSETLSGVSTIRAYRCQTRFKAIQSTRVNQQQQAYYLLMSANRWLAVRLEFIGTMVVVFSALFAFFGGLNGTISTSIAGLAVSYALSITQSLNWMVRMASDRESNIVSVERIQEYANDIPQEAPAIMPDSKLNPTWPEKGQIVFQNYDLRYRPSLPLVLHDLNIMIKSQEKIGIVGRTGAGKSSLLIAMLRLIEPAGGAIIVDNVDITSIGLRDLRSRFSIIPQDPVLFSGTLRFNIDPFNTCTDEAIWRTIERAHLKDFVVNQFVGGLDGMVEEHGSNLSVGQKQLVCLSRALLRHSTILLLDEATSAVDPVTDRLIQITIREEFKHCTILTIAHRLRTILDYDRILVLDSGHVVEFGTPVELLQRMDGSFRNLCIDEGIVVNTDSK